MEEAWRRQEKMPADLFHCLYGAMVSESCKHNDPILASRLLTQFGERMGARCVEEVAARCPQFATVFVEGPFVEAAEAYCRALFKLFLNMTVTIGPVLSPDTLVFTIDDTLTRHVQLPDQLALGSFHYLQPYTGMIARGLEELGWRVECVIVKDVLRGDAVTEFRVRLVERLAEERPPTD